MVKIEDLTNEQSLALETVVRQGVDAVAGMLRESYDARVRAMYIIRLINEADASGDAGGVRAEVKRLLENDGDE